MTEESDIKKEIKDYLASRGAYWSAVTGGPSSKIGDPDIIACYLGKFIALEGKTYTGTQDDWQKTRQFQIEAAGGVYAIVHSVDDVKDVLDAVAHPKNPWVKKNAQSDNNLQ